MKYCSNCGQQLEDDVMLCPNCGQSTEPEAPADEVPAAEAPAAEAPAAEAPAAETPAADGEGKKFKLSPKVIGIAAGAAVLILVLALLIPMLGGGTQVDFLSIQKDFLSERLAPVTAQLEKMAEAKGFSSDITISADIAGLDDFLEDTSVLLKVDAQAEKLLMDAEITLMGTPALSGKVEYNKGKLGFILPELDEKYYVMDLSTVLSELTGEEIDLTKADTLELPEKELEALAKEYLEIALGVMTKENVTKVKEDGIRFDKLSSYRMSDEEEDILSDLEDDFKGTVYTFAPKAEDIEAVLEALAEKLENDEKLRELIAETLQQEELTEIVSEDLMEEYVDMDDLIDDIEDMLDDLADEIRDNAEEFAEAVEDAGFVWTLCMEGKQVRMIRLETEEEECAAVYANSTDKSGEVTELFYYCDYGSCEVVEHVYTVDGKKVEGEVNVDSADFSFEYELDTAKTSKLGLPYGTYEVKVDGVKVELEVLESKAGGVDHVISISDPYSDMDAEVTVNLTEKGSAKAPGGKSTDISDYDEDDFAELFEDMGGELIDVLSDIDDLEELMDELYWYF